MRLVTARLLGLACLAGLLTVAALSAAPVTPETKTKPVSPADKIRQDLDQVISLEIAEQPLNLAVNQLREQTKINFVLDKFTLMQMGIDPDQMPVSAKLKDVKLRTALRMLFGPYNLSYAIIGDTVIISTDDVAMQRQMHQRVNVEVDDVVFAQALKQLARETVTNLVLDPRASKEAQGKITLSLEDVPLETAVRLMCEMVNLKPVRVGNTLFICTRAVAQELRNDPEINPGAMPPPPGAKGAETTLPNPPPGVILPGGPGALPGVGPGGPVGPGVLPRGVFRQTGTTLPPTQP